MKYSKESKNMEYIDIEESSFFICFYFLFSLETYHKSTFFVAYIIEEKSIKYNTFFIYTCLIVFLWLNLEVNE